MRRNNDYLLFQCPVFDSLETVQYNGLRQTVSKTGGIIVAVCLFSILFILEYSKKKKK